MLHNRAMITGVTGKILAGRRFVAQTIKRTRIQRNTLNEKTKKKT